jgi:hypothetical protein
MRAAIEFKAGCEKTAHTFLSDALASVSDPAPVWLCLRYLGEDYELPEHRLQHFARRFIAAMVRKPSPNTLAMLADLLLKNDQEYAARSVHEELIEACIGKSLHAEWTEPEFCRVCDFLLRRRGSSRLAGRFVRAGLTWFPQSIDVCLRAGLVLARRQGLRAWKKALQHVQQTIMLAEAAGLRPDDARVRSAQQMLVLLERLIASRKAERRTPRRRAEMGGGEESEPRNHSDKQT